MATLHFSSLLTVRHTRLSTVGDWVFPVASTFTWNSLPQHVTSTPSMSVFRGRLKAFLFRRFFPWLVTTTFLVPVQWLSSFLDTLVVLFTYLRLRTYLVEVWCCQSTPSTFCQSHLSKTSWIWILIHIHPVNNLLPPFFLGDVVWPRLTPDNWAG